jgi:hypothetical protein
MPPKLGIIAGGGNLPRRIVAACRAAGRPYFVLAFHGHTSPETVEDSPHAWVRLGAGGTSLKILRREGVEELVLAGSVRRPSFAELKPDLWTARFLARVGPMALGDDGLLGAVVRELETREGFRVIGAETLVPQVLAPEGVLGRVQPDDQAMEDVARGVEVARGICALDVGQAAVVQQGIVLAIEAIEGTDAMVARAGTLRRDGPGGVLVKVGQPKRESRADLPAVGENTVTAAARAGLRGIAVEAGGALLIDRERIVAAADAAGLFVLGVRV